MNWGLILFCIGLGQEAIEWTWAATAPEVVTVFRMDKNTGHIVYRTSSLRQVHEERIVKKKGREFKQTSLRHVSESQYFLISLKEANVYNVQGKKLAEEEVWKRLGIGTTLLKSLDGRKVNPSYLRIVRPDTLILVLQTREPIIIREEPVQRK